MGRLTKGFLRRKKGAYKASSENQRRRGAFEKKKSQKLKAGKSDVVRSDTKKLKQKKKYLGKPPT